MGPRTWHSGAFSKVYRGIDTVTGQEVAIKKTEKASMKTKQKENLLREAAIHKRLHHPNIVQFIDFFETSENYYLIMELCVPCGGCWTARSRRANERRLVSAGRCAWGAQHARWRALPAH